MCVAVYRRQRAHQVDMDMGETARRHAVVLNKQAQMSGHLGSLAFQAARSPDANVLVHARPQKNLAEGGASDIRVGKGLKHI